VCTLRQSLAKSSKVKTMLNHIKVKENETN
jgi:hypothetical protein